MAAKSRRPKRTSRKPARKPARAKASTRKRRLAVPKGRARKAARPKTAKRRPATKRPAPKARKVSVGRKPVNRAVKRARPTSKSAAAGRKQPAAPQPVAPQSRPAPRRRPAVSPAAHARPGQRPALDRDRRVLSNEERFDAADELTTPTEDTARMLSAARTGRHEMREQLEQHTESSPRLTAGDVDAKWQDAYAVGDEAPGGDNPTPDQDIVDDIGKALGMEYDDDEELKGAGKLEERDKHRWELDPASSEDWPHEDKDSDK